MKNSRRGTGFVEVTFAAIVLAAALIPLARSFSSGYARTTMGRVQYLALHVGRARLEELRHLPLARLVELPHDVWVPATGHVLSATCALRGAAPEVVADPLLALPPEYARIRTRLRFPDGPPAGRALVAVEVDVCWQEHGAATERAPEALAHFATVLADHHVVPEEAL